MSTYGIENRTYVSNTSSGNFSTTDSQTLVRVYLVNGESRCLRLDDRTEVTDIVRFILHRLRVNMEVAPHLFGILLKHSQSAEMYWLQPGYTVQELLHEYCGMRPLEEWKFLLRIRVLPKTPQHLQSQDPITFQYYYDQVLHEYLEDGKVTVDNETAVKLGCLELRRFYKDMPQIALKRKENFTMLERDIGLEKFFKKTLLNSVRRKNLRTLVLNAFQQYETLTMEGCVFQFFNLLAKCHTLDLERFTNCAVGDDQSLPLTCDIFVGPNCNVECQADGRERRFLAAFNDIQEIMYEVELITRGRIILDLKSSIQPVIIRTAQLVTAVHMATLIDGYCIVYTQHPHSRIASATRKRYSNASRFSGLYNTINEVRIRGSQLPDPYLTYRRSNEFAEFRPGEDDYATVRDPEGPLLGKAIGPREVLLGDKIGEGQFGDVHKGILYPDTQEEIMVAIKTCKPDATHEEKTKFLEEAAVMRKFNHPHIIKLFGVMSHEQATYIVMELAPLGQLRRHLLTEGSRISKAALLDYIQQLASAMLHLESKNYVHRDIAARNVLVSSPEVVKLADFGLSRGLEDHDYYVASRGKLPIKWMAPESINFRRFTGLSDVWMFGVCCWEILMRGVKPFVGIKNDEVISKIEMGERLPLPPECPAHLFRLMTLCWEYDPAERPNFVDIEHTINEIVEEERKIDLLTQRRGFGGIQRDPSAPEKPRRPPSSQQLRQTASDTYLKRHSAVSVDEDSRRLSDNVDERGEDNALPLPPRLASRFRELSVSPTPERGSPGSTGSDTPPPKPPRRERSTENLAERERERERSRERDRLDHPPPLPIEPYKVTTITPVDPDAPYSTISRDSESPIPVITVPIPPPSIIRQPPRRDSNSDSGVYYSIPTEMSEGGSTRMLSNRGVFVDKELRTSRGSLHSSMESSRSDRLRPGEGRPVSSSDDSQGRSSPLSEERVDDTSFLKEDDEFVQKTTAVVKSVMELSNKVPLCRPNDYVELVKNVGLALRDLLGKVDHVLTDLPQQTHYEVSMAHKVLSSDMTNLVQAMSNAQKHYQTFLEHDYQKQMLRAAHVVAMNAKQLLDAVNNARRKALLMQR